MHNSYPQGHPCYGKPLHTHTTKAASLRCERLRKHPELIPAPEPMPGEYQRPLFGAPV